MKMSIDMGTTWLCILALIFSFDLGGVAAQSQTSEADAALKGLPLDIVHIFDRSGSVTQEDWDYWIFAAENVTNTVVNKTGLYQSETQNGATVTLISFGCIDTFEDTTTTRVHLDRSGDRAEIDTIFKLLSNRGPLDQAKTCFQAAADTVEAKEVEGRILAVSVYTDGLITDQKRVKTFSGAVASMNGALFGVGAGLDMRKDGKTSLDNFVGNESRVFQYHNQNTMIFLAAQIQQHALQAITSQITTEITSVNGSAIDDPESCIDEPLNLVFSGISSVENITSPRCVFAEDGVTLGEVQGTVSNSSVICEYSENNLNASLTVQIFDGNRTLGNVLLPLVREYCFDFVIETLVGERVDLLRDGIVEQCLGTNATAVVTGSGPSFVFLRQTFSSASLSCAILKGEDVLTLSTLQENAEGQFTCEINLPTESGLQLAIQVETEGGTPFRVGQTELTVVETTRSPCVNFGLLPEAGSRLCIGRNGFLEMSGKTIDTFLAMHGSFVCNFPGSNMPSIGEIVGENRVRCSTPPMLSQKLQFSLLVDANQEPLMTEEVTFEVDQCLTVYQADEPCAGEAYNVSVRGETVEALFGLGYEPSSCKFDTFQIVPEVELNVTTVTCMVPRWLPWSAEERKIRDVQEFEIIFGEATLSGNLTSPEICMDVSSHGVSTGRRLASVSLSPDCFPSCCRRANVSIELSGRTIAVLSERLELVQCSFERVDGVTITSPVRISGTTLTCTGVPGWSPFSEPEGDYASVSIDILNSTNLSVVDIALSSVEYFPTTANQTCLVVELDDEVCAGVDSQSAQFGGPTADALKGNLDAAMSECLVDSEVGVANGLSCMFDLFTSVDDKTVDFSLKAALAGLSEILVNFSDVAIIPCTFITYATTRCEKEDLFHEVSFNTTFGIDNALTNFICRFSISDELSTEVEAIARGNQTFSCDASTLKQVSAVEIRSVLHNATVAAGKLELHSSCEDSSNRGPDDGGLDPGLIALIVILILLFLLMMCCLFYYCWYKKRDEAKDEEAGEEPLAEDFGNSATKDVVNEDQDPEDDTFNVDAIVLADEKDETKGGTIEDRKPEEAFEYLPNQEVEVLVLDEADPSLKSVAILNIDGKANSSIDKPAHVWKKGVIVKRNSDEETYEVKLDDGESIAYIAEKAIRVPKKETKLASAASAPTAAIRPSVLKEDGSFKYPVIEPVSFQELPENQFEIVVDSSKGLGIKLGMTETTGNADTRAGRFVISQFTDLPSGGWGPIEGSGLVGISDELLEINGVNVFGLSLRAVGNLIKESSEEMKLKFGRNHSGPVNLFSSVSGSMTLT